MCFTTFFITSTNVSAEYDNPNKFLNWAEAIVIAPAEVKPATTGVDTKSTKNPENYNSFLKTFAVILFVFCYLDVEYHKLIQLHLQENREEYMR